MPEFPAERSGCARTIICAADMDLAVDCPGCPVPPAAPWWLPGAHLQTVWARLTRSPRLVTFRREILTATDGDDIILDHADGPSDAPRVLLLHGLEGSAFSLHTQGLAVEVGRAGWRTTVLNFRSCARDPDDIKVRVRNKRPRLYHSGDTEDLDQVVRTLVAREPGTPLFAIGFSLGGNVLLKWLGETADAPPAIRAAVTISVPYDLGAAARYLERPVVGPFYTHNFLRRLRPKALDVLARFPAETAHLDAARIRAARTLTEFDQCLTAPMHGFASAGDYYARCSAIAFLGRVRTPTLCISADDDPFFPVEALARSRAAASPAVTFAVTSWGGHTGFVAGPWPWRPHYWAEVAAVDWLRRAT